VRREAAAVLARFFKFALVGAAATALQYSILILLVSLWGLPAPTASTIGFVASAGLNYWLNYRFTFRNQQAAQPAIAHGPAMAKFAVLACVGLLINAALMKGLTGAGWYYVAAQIVATAVVLVWNFMGNSLWTFAGRSPVSAR
jgi:putative flippase GtrA